MPDPRPRLLIVDDDRAITSTLSPLLRELADVDTAHTVAEALERLASHTYAACVLDLVLGDDPAALHDALSSREVPTLLISGRDHAAIGPTAEARGWSYAAKPLSPAVLRGLVADLLGVDAPDPTQRGVRPPPAPRPGGDPKEVGETARAAPSTIVQAIDRVSDIVGVVAIYLLARDGKISGLEGVFAIGAILGVGTGLRNLAPRAGAGAAATAATGAGLGAVGLLVWHAWPALTTVAVLLGRARGLAVVALAALTSHR